MQLLQITTPQYGRDYGIGWIGFTHGHSFISAGITYLTRWWRHDNEPAVSHVFVVSGADSCIEANSTGVEETSLSQYFDCKKCKIYFRQPRGWTNDLGRRIAVEARTLLNSKYDFPLIIADAVSYSLIGRLINGLTIEQSDRVLTKIADSPKKNICDKVAIFAMNSQPELKNLGTLKVPPSSNNPQMLFSDEEIFTPYVTAIN